MVKTQATPYPLRMDAELRKRLQERAESSGVSLNELINDLLVNAVDAPHPITQIKTELAELKTMQAKVLDLLQGQSKD